MSQKKIINIFYFSGWIFWGLLLHPPIKLIFQFHGIRWIYLFVFSFFLSMLITPIVRKIAIFFSILDEPSCRKVHKDPTPLLGGLAVFISFVSSLLVNNILDRTVGFILLASSLIFIVGLIDDVRHLSAKLKLFIQIIGTLIVFMTGTKITLFPIHNVSEIIKHLSQTGNILLTFLWVIGITNAMNFLDGLDGLATGIGIVVSISLGIVAFQTEQFFLGWFAIAMAGSCLGFLPHNFNSKGPARIFLGDCGSTFIGFLLACLAIKGEWAANNALVSLCTPIMIFGILIFDMIHTTTSRIYTGKVKSFNDWVSFVGKDHIHHRLFRIFQNNKKTVFMILAINSCLSISAIAMRQLDALNSLLILIQGIIAFALFSAINYYQEKSTYRIANTRDFFRIHELFDVEIKFINSGYQSNGMILDLSSKGAKVVFPKKEQKIKTGDIININATAFDDVKISSPMAKIIRTKEVLFEGNDTPFAECGVLFLDEMKTNLSELISILHKKQIEKKQEHYNQTITKLNIKRS